MLDSELRALRLHDCACMNEEAGFETAAIAMWRRSLAINRNNARAMVSLGLLLWRLGETEEAVALAQESLNIEELSWAHLILARDHTVAGRLDEALVEFQRTVRIDQSYEPLFDLASAHLRLGEFTVGFPLHSAANRGFPGAQYIPPPMRWRGQPVSTLLVISRLGYGDEVMFSRFLPETKRYSVDRLVVLAKPDSIPFYEDFRQAGLVEVITVVENEQEFPYRIENFALPDIIGTQPYTIPKAAEARRRSNREGLRVGVVWSGSDRTATNPIRQVPFEELLPLATNPAIHLYSFQTGPKSSAIAQAHAQILVRDMSAIIEWDWALTARALEEIDVLVCPDCGIAHWAASRGVPIFLMLSAYCDWRWGVNRDDSPWYPSMRLFRQKQIGRWKPVIDQIKVALEEMNEQRIHRPAAGEPLGSAA